MRTVNPFVDEDAHPDNSVGYGVYNAGKRSLSLDLSKPESRPVVEDLIRWADIAIESWAPGAAERMGYGCEAFSAVNPRLIMLSSSLLGQSGPYSSLAGVRIHGGCHCRLLRDHGLGDRGPAGPYGPCTDSWRRGSSWRR
ncbi:CoA transferase [Candidatus Poriferisodalis sp.]|uniref:CoA transferase n=1 Tax=Candidatus Poriferisodalis sp. TaxID=3101277 RepID=UPI003B024986